MANVAAPQTLQTPQDSKPTLTTEGTLTLKSGAVLDIVFIQGTEAVTEGVFNFLQAAATLSETIELSNYSFALLTIEMAEVHLEIMALSLMIDQNVAESGAPPQKIEKLPVEPFTQKKTDLTNKSSKGTESHQEGQTSSMVYTSLFSLARACNQSLNAAKHKETPQNREKSETKQNPLLGGEKVNVSREETPIKESRFEREREQNKDKEKGRQGQGFGREQGKREDDSKKNPQKNKRKVTGVSAAKGTGSGSGSGISAGGGVPSIDNIFIRFMALMAKILGQAEAEAHQLYLRIKDRTDAIDILTNLISKINTVKGDIDWTKDEEMKKLVDKARELGVDIPQGKYKWNEDEKKLLKENVQMRKDSMEKVTQLERTDMQRYLQEASQCHQARSNILKLLKEVMDTIIHNIRP